MNTPVRFTYREKTVRKNSDKKAPPPFYIEYPPPGQRTQVVRGNLLVMAKGHYDDKDYGPEGALLYLPLLDSRDKPVGSGGYRGQAVIEDGPGPDRLTLTLNPGGLRPETYYLSNTLTNEQETYLRGFARGYGGKRAATGREAAFDDPEYGDGYGDGREAKRRGW